MHLVAAETVVAVSVALVATGWPKKLTAPWDGRGRQWFAGALAVWMLGWWVPALGSSTPIHQVDLGLATMLLAAVGVTVHVRPWLLFSWAPVAVASLVLQSLVPYGAPMGWPTGVIAPEAAVLGLLAGVLVGDPVLAAAAAVGGGSLGAGLEGRLGAPTWYLVSVAAAVAFGVGALVDRHFRSHAGVARPRKGW